MKSFLNVGCGPVDSPKIRGFDNDDWKEIRLDIDEGVNPDIVGTLTDMKLVETSSVDAVHSAYNIDHIYPHEVPIALAEFYRVLKEDGIVLLRWSFGFSVRFACFATRLGLKSSDTPVGHFF